MCGRPAAAEDPPRSPAESTPSRRSGSVRRTSHVDIAIGGITGESGDLTVAAGDWHGLGPRPLRITAVARDLLSAPVSGGLSDASQPRVPDGDVIAAAAVVAELTSDRTLAALEAEPAHPGLEDLLGQNVAAGFRAQVDTVLGEARTTPLGLVLDDLPTAALISGYANLRLLAGAGVPSGSIVTPEVLPAMEDLCSGWRGGGVMVESIASGTGVPIQDCPPAPVLDDPQDPLAWHRMAPVPARGMRRRRRVDLALVEGELVVDAMFRDSYGEDDGTEVVLHEYDLSVWADPVNLRVLEVGAVPAVLPFPECPLAADSVAGLVGVQLPDLRAAVRRGLGGIAGCTHLNDLLACLSDVWRLAERVVAQR